jgi:hypothetical protein
MLQLLLLLELLLLLLGWGRCPASFWLLSRAQ